jgi:hypothetical protein
MSNENCSHGFSIKVIVALCFAMFRELKYPKYNLVLTRKMGNLCAVSSVQHAIITPNFSVPKNL